MHISLIYQQRILDDVQFLKNKHKFITFIISEFAPLKINNYDFCKGNK